MRRSCTAVVALAALALAPGVALAQTNSQFTGEVTDNTGGILPGVTVEASSPVLIEGSRVAITDGAGRYTMVDLRPGTYNLTFTLPGFSVVVVESQELPAGFTATVNAELSVGALEETVTVSGEAPVVDVQSTRRVEVLSTEVLDAIPTGRNMQSTAQLIDGIKLNRPEVGLSTAAQHTVIMTHGMSWR
ncbi:MAG: carboxypeptidase-like regulatory domain-containing protein, partial [Acidobacteria bacterium]|nr:carboxypeptidase-like regulatory domain-containing protein [Acidobacteriota bacterium]